MDYLSSLGGNPNNMDTNTTLISKAMAITPDFFLCFTKYCVIVICISMALATILGVISVWKIGEAGVKPMMHLIWQGDALRMLTVIFLVSATTGLVVLGCIDGSHAATIFSGVAGYVLGSGTRSGSSAQGKEAIANTNAQQADDS